MLNKRIIPKILINFKDVNNVKTPVCVTTTNFKKINFVGDPISQGKIFEAQLADEIAIINFERISLENNYEYFNFLKEFASNIFLPISAGGGIKTLKDIENFLKHGADKIIINTESSKNKDFIKNAANNFGKQCVVVSIDFKLDNDKYEVFTNRGKDKINSDPLSWAQRMQEAGAGEIILTDIDKDGTKSGLNIKIAEEITKKIDIPVILSGGCGLAEHFVEGFKKTNIQGICAGTFFSYRDQNFFEARAHMLNNKINLR